MTSPIKPPGGPKPPIDPAAAESSQGPSSADRSERFQEALGATETPATSASTASSATELDSVVADLKAGRIDADAAVERLIADALQGPMASLLDDAGKAELEAHLRATLEDDPNLSALVRDMDR